MSKYKWFGSDVSNRRSLFESGLLLRRVRKGCYDAVVRVKGGYVFGTFWFDETIMEMDMDDTWGEVGDMVGMSGKEYRKFIVEECGGDSGAINLVFDRVMYYGLDDTISLSAYAKILTKNEVKIRLNKALSK